jgi:hypothetical protein
MLGCYHSGNNQGSERRYSGKSKVSCSIISRDFEHIFIKGVHILTHAQHIPTQTVHILTEIKHIVLNHDLPTFCHGAAQPTGES